MTSRRSTPSTGSMSRSGWRPESEVEDGRGSGFTAMLSDGTDIRHGVNVLIVGYFACPELAGGSARSCSSRRTLVGRLCEAPATVKAVRRYVRMFMSTCGSSSHSGVKASPVRRSAITSITGS